ncbi:AfsR/SARP family transcriptional regulator [Actinoplanes sp. NPDC049599]|uniref:AfsR/SARP family transcriptional regulator n=1 Tax=Actinoplanes sp. NPDC049599 TaxID=3363903 RepID=UPI003797C3FE
MRVRVLGPFEVDGPLGPCVVAGARQRTVLATLALHAGRPVAVGRLIDALWPEDPPPSARNSLQSHVARLRAALPEGAIRHEPAGYRLAVTPEQVDALRFERLVEQARSGADPVVRAELLDGALALWRGPALPEFPAGPLAGWAARLGAAHRTALADRAELPLPDPARPGGGPPGTDPSGGGASGRGSPGSSPADGGPPGTDPPGGGPPGTDPPGGGPPGTDPPGGGPPGTDPPGGGPPDTDPPGSGPRGSGWGDAGWGRERGLGGTPPLGVAARLAAEVAADPCWERGVLVLARLLPAAEAGAVLRRHAEAVVDVLGLDPSPAVRELQTALLRGDPPVGPAAAQRPGVVAVAASSGRGGAVDVPRYLSSFLGRDRERTALLAAAGLSTVAGPGGVGKTRLVAEAFRDRDVAWVDAADVRGRDDFLQAVAAGIGARPGPGDDLVRAIAAGSGRALVLDNCEHVLAPAAEVVEAILAADPAARIVVTSQERLRIDGEQVLLLPPLPAAAAAALFADRADGAVDLDDPVQAAAVGAVVSALDALPLAIELAATQAPALGVAGLRDRLDDRLDLLTRGRRTGASRQRTLRSVVDWSFGLLGADEQRVLVRLGVFAGAFTLALAEAVVADAALPRSRVAAAVAALVDRSLVSRAGPARFRLLETVRAYVRQHPAADDLRRRHAEAVVAVAEALDLALRGPAEAEAARDLDALLPDLRQAVETARDEPALIGRLASALYRYGYHGQRYEVLAWGYAATGGKSAGALAAAATHAWGNGDLGAARDLLAAAPPDPAVHEVLGDIALVRCEGDAALSHYRAMTTLATDGAVRASGLAGEALALAWTDRAEQAVAVGEAALDVADLTGNPTGRAIARYALGEALGDLDPRRALDLLDEAAELARGVDNRLFVGASTAAAVAIRSRHADPAAALRAFREVLLLWREAGNNTLQMAALRNLVVLLARIGADDTAALVDAALPAACVYPAEAARLGRARAAVAERLGPAGVEAARRRAAALSGGQVVEAALAAIDADLAHRPHPADARSRSGPRPVPGGPASLPLAGV